MTKKQKFIDVFKKINMHDGDRSVCWEWLGTIDKDRPYFAVNGKRYTAYRIVYDLMNEVKLLSMEVVRHKCDNGAAPICCCNPDHLEKGSHQENMNDMKERERHGLSHHMVKGIKRLLKKGRTHQEIADLYGVSRENISAINQGRTYSHVEE